MHSTKFYRLTTKLSRQEMRDFRDFIASPYFNKHKILEKFARVFEESVMDCPDNPPSKEEFYKLLYKGKKYSAKNLSSLLNKAVSLFWEFIATQESLRDTLTRQKYLLTGLNHKAWSEGDDFKPFADAWKALKEFPHQDAEFFQQRLDMEAEWYRYEIRQTRGTRQVSLQPLLNSLDSYFLIRALEFACAAANLDNIHGTQHKIPPSIEGVLQVMQYHEKQAPPLARMYYHCYHTLVDRDCEEPFFVLKPLLFKYAGSYSLGEAIDLYTYAVNFCARRINAGEVEFLSHANDLYRHLIDDLLNQEEAKLSAGFFKNIVMVMATLAKSARPADFSWVEDFLETYRGRLIKDNEGVAYTMCKGILHFFKEDYRGAESLFHQVLNDVEDVFYRLDARAYLWKCYYELNDLRAFDAAYNSLRMSVKRAKEIAAYHRENYNQFIKNFQAFATIQRKKIEKLIESQEDTEKRIARLKRLRDHFREAESTVNMNWLLEKVNEAIEEKELVR
ncbi:MAG: hypothetical protein H6581_14240 [Bacteroidia bacterium]|nr:hypothetical protein [Bacteroidia bacterium]